MVKRRRIAIAGGGVAALEALLTIRDLMGHTVDVDLVCPQSEFVYRPSTVTEPFEMGRAQSFDLGTIARELRAHLRLDALAEVDAPRRWIRLGSGAELHYDALLVATGGRRLPWLEGAVTFRGRGDVESLRAVLGDLEAGHVPTLAFAGVPGDGWQLPLYELALLAAAHVADLRLDDVRLLLVTPEAAPLGMFGPRASEAVRRLLVDRGIELYAATYPSRFTGRRLHVVPRGTLPVEAVVTLARVEGRPLAGLPHDDRGFVPTDVHGRVPGLEDVYAAGDATTFPIKQGGIAAQQADAAVQAIAASFGVSIVPEPFAPVLRGMLITGLGPRFLRRDVSGRVGDRADTDTEALWWPPAKIAGERLASYLAEGAGVAPASPLRDREASDRSTAIERRAARDLMLALADAEGGWGHFDEAIRVLDAAAELEGALPPEYAAKRRLWESSGAVRP